LDLAWYFEDGILHITSREKAKERRTTHPHNIGDLLDAGYAGDDLLNVIESTVDYDSWQQYGGEGSADLLGDVMFVRQTDEVHRKVQGLLTALRKFGRQTFVLDPSRHLVLRGKLKQNVSVGFADTPLEAAVKKLSKDAGADIRLDRSAMRELRVREREPISLKLTDCKLETALQAMTANLKLTWILRDGVVWITGPKQAEGHHKTAVFDVRDLCRDESESEALIRALTMGASPDHWQQYGGEGIVCVAKPGVLVVCNQERILMEVLDLLETYRKALRASRPRKRDQVDPKEVITIYYRLHANVAKDLETMLPWLVRPDTWKGTVGAKVEAPGEITRVASPPELSGVGGKAAPTDGPLGYAVSGRAVLIIRQTRETHDEIDEVIRRIEMGDRRPGSAKPTSGGMGMGGFGGGFLSVPDEKTTKDREKR
jgi:hypothetical protein